MTTVKELVAKLTELETRSVSFAARTNALIRASRDEIRALHEEMAGLKARPMNTQREPLAPALPKISAQAWAEAMKALKAVPGEERTFFPPAEVRGMALKQSAPKADAPCDEEVEL